MAIGGGGKFRLEKAWSAGRTVSTTINSTTNFPFPFGKHQFKISGRGGTGNSPVYAPGNYVPGNYVPGNYVPGNADHVFLEAYWVSGGADPPVYAAGDYPAGYSCPPTYVYGNPGQFTYWSCTTVYNPSYSNPGYDNSYTNPSSYNPGAAGSSTNVMGVTFPGGDVGSVAPTVSANVVYTRYTNSQLYPNSTAVNVPSGGYITIELL